MKDEFRTIMRQRESINTLRRKFADIIVRQGALSALEDEDLFAKGTQTNRIINIIQEMRAAHQAIQTIVDQYAPHVPPRPIAWHRRLSNFLLRPFHRMFAQVFTPLIDHFVRSSKPAVGR
jgi:hypothetical protein